MPTNKKKLKTLAKNPNKISAKRLAKAAPEDVQRFIQASSNDDLQAKNLALENLAYDTLAQVDDEEMYDMYEKDGKKTDTFEVMSSKMAQMVVPVLSDTMVMEPRQIQSLRKKLEAHIRIVNRMDNDRRRETGDTNNTDPIVGAERMQSVVDRVVQFDRDEIIATCFSGNEDAFQRHCSTFLGISPEAFFELTILKFPLTELNLEAGVLGKVNTISSNVGKALRGAAFGMHETVWICWYCGGKAEKTCNRCHVAKYCSRDCQASHWKKVHKQMCKHLKPVYESFQKSLEAIDEAYSDQQKHIEKYGMPPNSAEDYILARQAPFNAMISKIENKFSMEEQNQEYDDHCRYNDNFEEIPPFLTDHDGNLGGPCMKYFYQNLKYVLYFGFWMRPPPVGLDCKTKIIPKQCEKNSEWFWAIAEALTYDYSQLPRVEAILMFLHKVHGSNPEAIYMSPEEWLYNYDDGYRCSSEEEEEGYTLMMRKRAELDCNEFLRGISSKQQFVELFQIFGASERQQQHRAAANSTATTNGLEQVD